MSKDQGVTRWLQSSSPAVFNGYCIIAAFVTYFCMYAFRKPFSVGTFSGQVDLGFLPPVDYKIVLIFSQVFGYTLSKFLGIKVVSEATQNKRALYLLLFIGLAELSLILFAIVPDSLKPLMLFLNGLPLGMVWGLTFSFLEGRKSTELLGAGLSTSYIVASGAVKSVGRMVLSWGVPENYMPLVTGLIFFPALLLAVKMLSLIPAPTREEEILRTKRVPMNQKSRQTFFFKFAPGLVCLTIFYMFLTAYRDFRDNFAREIWDSVGHGGEALIFTSSELPIAVTVLAVLAAVMFVKNNQKAVAVVHGLLVTGSVMIGLSTWLFTHQMISPLAWMVTVGLGLYLGYVPFGCVLFDRIIASTKFVGTAGFMIYMTDSFGYLGSVLMMLYKNFGHANLSWLEFFVNISYFTSVACSIGFFLSGIYFWKVSSGSLKPVAYPQKSSALQEN